LIDRAFATTSGRRCPSPAISKRQIDLTKCSKACASREILGTPVIIRFRDLLKHRLTEIRLAFDAAIAEHQYTGNYCCVYPIKVNQQRPLCEEVRDIGKELGFGLEAGSKPELLAVLGLTENLPHARRLQRLQGLGVHRDGDPRDQAGSPHHPRRRAFQRP
jgi:arginine decarboxylase-like protein